MLRLSADRLSPVPFLITLGTPPFSVPIGFNRRAIAASPPNGGCAGVPPVFRCSGGPAGQGRRDQGEGRPRLPHSGRICGFMIEEL